METHLSQDLSIQSLRTTSFPISLFIPTPNLDVVFIMILIFQKPCRLPNYWLWNFFRLLCYLQHMLIGFHHLYSLFAGFMFDCLTWVSESFLLVFVSLVVRIRFFLTSIVTLSLFFFSDLFTTSTGNFNCSYIDFTPSASVGTQIYTHQRAVRVQFTSRSLGVS